MIPCTKEKACVGVATPAAGHHQNSHHKYSDTLAAEQRNSALEPPRPDSAHVAELAERRIIWLIGKCGIDPDMAALVSLLHFGEAGQ